MSEQTVTLKFTTTGSKEVTAVVKGVAVTIDEMEKRQTRREKS